MVRRFEELKTGDTFAWQITTEEYPDFKNRYLIITYYYNKYSENDQCKIFRVKITKTDKIPQNIEEISKLESIKLAYNIYDLATQEYSEAKAVKPDKYGYIYQYTVEVLCKRKTIPKQMIYIGNFKINAIENEFYFAKGPRNQYQASWKYFEENILQSYVLYNQKQFIGYTKEGNKEIYARQLDFENFRKHLKKLGDAIDGPNGNEVLKKLGIDIENEVPLADALTYIGPDKDEGIKKNLSAFIK